jgi:hypothetical protein
VISDVQATEVAEADGRHGCIDAPFEPTFEERCFAGLIRPVVVNSPVGPILTFTIRGMTDTKRKHSTDTDDTDGPGSTASRSSLAQQDTGDQTAHGEPGPGEQARTPGAISYAGDRSEGTELRPETHGTHYRGTYGDL